MHSDAQQSAVILELHARYFPVQFVLNHCLHLSYLMFGLHEQVEGLLIGLIGPVLLAHALNKYENQKVCRLHQY